MQNNKKISALVLIEDLGMMFATENSKQKSRFCIYKCKCGNEILSRKTDVTNYKTISCGCKSIENSTTHGLCNHNIYGVWNGMIQRVYNSKNSNFKYYGYRGITICERWLDVANFIEDMYPTYQKGLTIDRINNDGNYEPSNCRWTTKAVQARNTRAISKNNTSGYRGVSKNRNKWRAIIYVNSLKTDIGSFNTSIEAAKAYDTYVIENELEHNINGIAELSKILSNNS